jgi:hypothetical protein
MSRSGNDRVVTALGESALTGWQGAVGRAVARPVARRTRWSEDQIRAVIGLLILAYGLYRVLRPTIRAVRRAA